MLMVMTADYNNYVFVQCNQRWQSYFEIIIPLIKEKWEEVASHLYFDIDSFDAIGKQVDILISKNQALQILYLRHCI